MRVKNEFGGTQTGILHSRKQQQINVLAVGTRNFFRNIISIVTETL